MIAAPSYNALKSISMTLWEIMQNSASNSIQKSLNQSMPRSPTDQLCKSSQSTTNLTKRNKRNLEQRQDNRTNALSIAPLCNLSIIPRLRSVLSPKNVHSNESSKVCVCLNIPHCTTAAYFYWSRNSLAMFIYDMHLALSYLCQKTVSLPLLFSPRFSYEMWPS